MNKSLPLRHKLMAAVALLAGTFTATAEDTTITLCNPVAGSSLADFKDAGSIRVYVKDAPEAQEIEVVAKFYDPAYEEPKITTNLWPAAPDPEASYVHNYAQEIFENYEMITGTDYTLNISVVAVNYPEAGGREETLAASKDFTLKGSGTPFVYSTVQLTGIDPNPVTTDIISTDQNVITLTFDGEANVTKAGTPLGMGMGIQEWTVAKDETVTDGTVWTVTIPTDVIEASKTSIPVSIWAEDKDGNPICTTTLEGITAPTLNKEDTHFYFDYICTIAAPDFKILPSDPNEDDFTVVEQLDKFYVYFAQGINPSYLTTEKVILYKGKGADQELVQEWDSNYFDMMDEDICVVWDWDGNYKWCLALDEAITEPGAYFLTFPNAFFNLGGEYNQALSRSTTAKYLIEAPAEPDNVTTDPAVGSTVSSLQTIKITWVDAADAGVDYNVTDPINVYDADNNIVITGTLDMSEDFNDPWNMLILTLEQEITTAGVYTINIPAGKVLLNDAASSSSELNLVYTVGEESGIESIKAVDLNGDVYNLSGVRVLKAGEDTSKLVKGVYIINGNKVIK